MRIHAMLAAISALVVTVAFAAEPVPPETVLVKRGDTTVTAGDFMASIARLPEDQRTSFRADVQRIVSAVSAIYLNRALAAEARAAGVDKDPETRARLKLAEEQLLAQLYMDKFEKTIKTPDYSARALEAYRADPARYSVPEKVKFRHILVSFQGRTKEEAKRRAEEARAKLLAKESFVRTAREYSNDPTLRGNDGVIGPVPYATLITPLAEVAKKSPIDAVSEIFESSEGYHVIVVVERRPAAVIPFEKAKKDLIEAEEAKFRKAIVDKKLAAITHSTDITLYTDEIVKLQTEIDRDELRRMHEEEAEREEAAKAKAAKGG